MSVPQQPNPQQPDRSGHSGQAGQAGSSQPAQSGYSGQPGQPDHLSQSGQPGPTVPPGQSFPPGQTYGPAQAYGPPQTYPGVSQAAPYGRPVQAPLPVKQKKKFYRRAWFWIVAAVLVIGFFAAGTGGSGDEDEARGGSDASPAAEDDAPVEDNDDAEAETDAQASAGIGDPVVSGDLQLTVTDVETGVSTLGSDYLTLEASGQFIVVSVSVVNNGSEAVYFSGGDVTLVDEEGRTFSNSSEAGIYVEDANSLFEQINPGSTVQGVVVFDVSEDTDPATLEFSGGLFSEKAVVDLG